MLATDLEIVEVRFFFLDVKLNEAVEIEIGLSPATIH